MHGQRVAHQVRHQRVAGLVVGEDALLLLADDAALLEAGDDALHRRLELGLADAVEVAAAGEDRRLVADVREVGAGETGGLARDGVEVDVVRERLAARVDLEDLLAAGEVGRRDEQLPVEAARAEQRGVEVLDAVRRGHDDDLVGRGEAVELDEQLVQRLVLLAVEAVAGARGADGVELVDEDDRRRVLARGGEELADARGAEARRTSRRTRTRSASRSCAPDSWATAFASSVLPVPGGP